MLNQGGPAGAFSTMDFSFHSDGSDDEDESHGGKKGYEFYYNQELRKAMEDLQATEAGYLPVAGVDHRIAASTVLEPAHHPGALSRSLRGQDPAVVEQKVRDLMLKFERLELRDLRRLIRAESPQVQARVPRWDFRRIVCRALNMPYLTENEILATQLFDLLDVDLDGSASWLQVIAGLAVMAQLGRGEVLRLLLELCDTNNDGWLHYEEVMSMLRAVAEGRRVDDSALRQAMTDAEAVHVDDFYRWSGKEVLLEWIDRFSVHFETKLVRLRSVSSANIDRGIRGSAAFAGIGSVGTVVAGTFESKYVAGASGDPKTDKSLLEYMARLAHNVRRPEEIERAVHQNQGKVGVPVGEVEVRAVLLSLLSNTEQSYNQYGSLHHPYGAPQLDVSQFGAITTAQLQRLITAERASTHTTLTELQVAQKLSALGISCADHVATHLVRAIQHDGRR